MSNIVLDLDISNDVFVDNEAQEIKRILLKLVNSLEDFSFKESDKLPIKDINGNTSGYFIINIEE